MSELHIQALFGGMLIGGAALLLMLTLGKIAGISGILFHALRPSASDKIWRWSFLVGLVIAPLLTQQFAYSLPLEIKTDMLTLAVAGLFVGIGTKIGAGCTSGHGICGVGRLSKRSLTATATFMLTAFITVFVTNHLM